MPCPARDLDKICKADNAHCGDSTWNRSDYENCPSYWRFASLPDKEKFKQKAKDVDRRVDKLTAPGKTPDIAPKFTRGDGHEVS